MIEHQKELMDVDTFLDIYGIGRSMYFNHVKKKQLKVTKIGRRTFIKRSDAEAWLKTVGEED